VASGRRLMVLQLCTEVGMREVRSYRGQRWPAVAFTEKVVAAEQGTGGGEKGKSRRLEAARDER
jgi:hypothetical protein